MTGAPVSSAGFVVVGASLAGLRAVEAARRAGYTGPITLIGDEPHLPYNRPPLSKEFLSEGAEPEHHLDADGFAALGVTLRLGVAATGLDAVRRAVLLSDGGEVHYDRLLVATGSSPRRAAHLPDMPGVFMLRTLDHAAGIRRTLGEESKVIIVGAGFIGSEIASSAKKRGANVTIVEAAPVPLVRAVGEAVGEAISRLHERNGVRLLRGTQVEELFGEDRVRAVRLSSGESIAADLVIVGIGAAPATAWLAGSGVELDTRDGGVLCDAFLQSTIPGVYAAGDLAHWPNGALDLTMRAENWTNAAEQGAQAATNAVAPHLARPYEQVPYFWSDWYGHRIQFVGSALAESVSFASGGPDEDRFVALYRSGDRLIGAATLNEPRKIMKLRRVIGERGSWDSAASIVRPTAVAR